MNDNINPRCCDGTPSGHIEPDGTAALMCDDACACPDCTTQRPS